MYMFSSVLERIPKNRSEVVNELEVPDVTTPPYILERDVLDGDAASSAGTDLTGTSDSSLPLSRAITDSDIDYDSYGRYKAIQCYATPFPESRRARPTGFDHYRPVENHRQTTYLNTVYLGAWFKNRRFTDPWAQMQAALDAFPTDYLDSLKSCSTADHSISSYNISVEYDTDPTSIDSIQQYRDELKLKMQRFFDEECCVYEPGDPAYTILQRALSDLNLKEWESSSISSQGLDP